MLDCIGQWWKSIDNINEEFYGRNMPQNDERGVSGPIWDPARVHRGYQASADVVEFIYE